MSFLDLSSGKLIEYLDNGRFVCGYVTESQPRRIRLLNQNGRELNLPVSRVIHCSDVSYHGEIDRESLIKLLQETTAKRDQLMAAIDLEMVWELTAEEETATFEPQFLAELVFGHAANDDIVSAFLRSIFHDKRFFKYREGKIRAYSIDQVAQLRTQQKKEAQKQKLVASGLTALQRIDRLAEKAAPFSEEEQTALSILQNFSIWGNEAEDADLAKMIIKQGAFTTPHYIYQAMVSAGLWHPHINIPLIKNNLPVSFSVAARKQAEAILQNGNQSLFHDPQRKDLTHLKPLTIDGATTLDFDDALTIEQENGNYLVGIHISDVAHYVRPGDPLFQEAMQRGSSIYFPEGQVPMLPRHLSQGVCSLIQGEVRAALSHLILLSPEAEVLRVRIVPSLIKVARRLTYEEADRLINDDPELILLDVLRQKLRQKRVAHGALLLPFPDVNIHLDSGNQVHVSLGKTDTPARTIIAEFMILANTQAATFVSNRLAPGLFRSQTEIKKRLVFGEDDDLFINTLQRKHLPRAELTIEAKSHSGLGVACYTTITSPIRRLLDLVMQHQINTLVRRRDLCFTQDMCQDFISVITRTLTAVNSVKQQRHRYWLLKYLEQRVNTAIEALVINAGVRRINLLLPEILMDIDLPATKVPRPEPGTMVKVRIVKVDALDNIARFEW